MLKWKLPLIDNDLYVNSAKRLQTGINYLASKGIENHIGGRHSMERLGISSASIYKFIGVFYALIHCHGGLRRE
jgi:hypothetical protein